MSTVRNVTEKKGVTFDLQKPQPESITISFPPVGILWHAISLTAPRGLRSAGFFVSRPNRGNE